MYKAYHARAIPKDNIFKGLIKKSKDHDKTMHKINLN